MHSCGFTHTIRHRTTKDDLSDLMKVFLDSVSDEELLILDGEPFKADEAYAKICKTAKSNIILIDDYIGIKTLHHPHSCNDLITRSS